jgi:hypothetical protein
MPLTTHQYGLLRTLTFKVLQVKEKFGGLRFYVRLDGLRLSHADDANPGLALPWKNPSIPVRLRPAGGTAGRTFD